MLKRVGYLLVFISFAAVTSGVGILGQSIWQIRACAHASRPDAFVAYCNDAAFGDYEHGALYYGFEPQAIKNMKQADVLILGSSRTQFAFSTAAVEEYFTRRGIKYFLLGFGYGEASDLPLAIMQKFGAKPKVIIANSDPFFGHHRSEPTAAILRGTPPAWAKYLLKKTSIDLLSAYCVWSVACPQPMSFVYRSMNNGFWIPMYFPQKALPFEPSMGPFDQSLIDAWSKVGLEFLGVTKIPPECVILTGVPTPNLSTAAIATGLSVQVGVSALNIAVPEMATMDGAHLNDETAERWSAAFLAAADPIISRCLARQKNPGSVSFIAP
ncbi:hypothetical protein V1282_006914 [Nitrobacteraceae bacterium AZCC 2146]